jgi:hypothetical protein
MTARFSDTLAQPLFGFVLVLSLFVPKHFELRWIVDSGFNSQDILLVVDFDGVTATPMTHPDAFVEVGQHLLS